MNSLEIVGTVLSTCQWYADGLERLEIRVSSKTTRGLPLEDGKRVRIRMLIGPRQFLAGIRSLHSHTNVWICPDLRDEGGKKVSLAKALQRGGFEKNQRVIFRVVEPMEKYRLEIVR